MQSTHYYQSERSRVTQAGFSLIEVLVSLAIFAIVVTMSVGTMIVMIDANSKARFTQTIVSNAAFALDSMTRDIRTGVNYVCSNSSTNSSLAMDSDSATPQDCPSGASAFAFSETGQSLTGSLASNRIGFRHQINADGVGQIQRKLSTNGAWLPITADNVNITELTFVARGTDTSDNLAPTVVIYIKGEGVGDMQNTEFNLQTTITQIALDI